MPAIPTVAAPPAGFFTSGAAFSSLDETWTTPRAFFEDLDAEFGFTLDSCAFKKSTLVPANWYGPDHSDPQRRDALVRDWAADVGEGAVWMTPPYGRGIGMWMHAAVAASDAGATVVALVPSRTDTRWMWDTAFTREAAGRAEVRFVQGRLKFGAGIGSAPFPSVVIIFTPPMV